LAHGTPMLQAGDEFGRTQNGNNNAYCQDNELNWIDWDGIPKQGRDLVDFVRQLIALRRTFPILHRGRFIVGQYNETLDVKDATWLSPSGAEMTPEQWEDPRAKCLGVVLDGRAQPTGIRRRGADATVLLVLNAHHDVVEFTLPTIPEGDSWVCLIDTNVPHRIEDALQEFGDSYELAGFSLLLFALEPKGRRSRTVPAGRPPCSTSPSTPSRATTPTTDRSPNHRSFMPPTGQAPLRLIQGPPPYPHGSWPLPSRRS
jgi:isoamylase